MQLPAGLLSDSWGARKTITVYFCIGFAGSVLLGLATTIPWAIAGRTMVGIGIAMLFVPTMKVLAEWFRVREFAMMTGILMAMGGIGSLTAATPLALLSSWIGWRHSFVAVGLFTLFLAVLVWMVVRDRPADLGWPSPTGGRAPQGSPIRLRDGVRMVLKTPAFWPVAVWFFFTCAVFFSFGGLWGGPYLMQVYGMTKAQAGHVLSMFALGMIFGSPSLGYLSNQVFRGRKPVLMMSGAALVVLTGFLAFMTDRIPLAGLYLICLGLGIFASAIVVIGFTTAKELFPVQITGTAVGLANLFPFLGGALFQPIVGYVLESRAAGSGGAFTVSGYRQGFLTLFFCAVIAFFSTFFLRETLREE
jgi:sugar phosphate permease